jgi:hypothetical protein
MRKAFSGVLIAVLLSTSFTFAEAAVIKSGAPCTQLGAKKVIGGKSLKCTKSGNKKIWMPSSAAKPTAKAPADPANFLVYSPVDPSIISKMSKFRSCVGHDYSPGFSAKLQNKPYEGLEIARSMKHYLYLKAPFVPAGTVKGIAPFNGTIRVQREQSGNGQQVFIMNDSGWIFVFFHGDPLVQNGDKVLAGTPVISWWSKDQSAFAASNGGTLENSSVDFALIDFAANKFEAPFLHFTPEVLASWKAKSFDKEALIITQSQRDSAPCSVGGDGERFSGQAASDQYVVASS